MSSNLLRRYETISRAERLMKASVGTLTTAALSQVDDLCLGYSLLKPKVEELMSNSVSVGNHM
jgi:hypothetical protein